MPSKPLFGTVALRRIGRGSVLLAALLTMTVAVQAADRDRLRAFLDVTGFGIAVDSIALSAADAPMMLGMRAGDFGATWRETAQDVFDTDKMRATAMEILDQTLTDDLLNHAAAFYASPLGQRLVEVENAAHMIEDDSEKTQTGERLVARMRRDDDPRLKVLRDLTTAVNGDDVAVRAVQEIQVRFLMAASNAGVLETPLDERALRALMRENEDELRQSLRESSLIGAAYTYRSIPDADLRRYLEALKAPKMQRVYELMNAVQYEIMANRFEALADRMADLSGGREL